MQLDFSSNQSTIQREHIPAGDYYARVESIEQRETPSFDDPDVKVKKLLWTFAVKGKTREANIPGWTTIATGEKSHLRRWVTAIMGDLPLHIETDDLIGATVRVTVREKTSRAGEAYSEVCDVMAAELDSEDIPF